MKWIKLRSRISLFWSLQIIGWVGYTLDRYLSERVFFPVFFTYIIIAFLLTLLLRPIYHRLWSKSPSVILVGVVAVSCSIGVGFLWLLISDLFFSLVHIRPYPDKPMLTYLLDTARYTLVHHKPFLFLSWSALYFGIKYWQDNQRQEQNVLRASALAKEAELQMLRYQLNPHFLFNSLNSASALIREDPRRAEKMINQLSEFLRYSLIGAKVKEISIQEELEAARNYLDVEKIRYEDKIAIRFDISRDAEQFLIPGLILHPLIENAVKYGMQTSALPLTIAVKAHLRGNILRLEVTNSGRWLPRWSNGMPAAPNGTGVGLQNVRQRLQQAFPNHHTFEVFEKDNQVHAVMEITRDGKPNE